MQKFSLILFSILFIATTASAQSNQYDKMPKNASPMNNNAKIEIDNRIKSSDRLNTIDGELNKYKNGTSAKDRYEYDKYQQERSKEILKR